MEALLGLHNVLFAQAVTKINRSYMTRLDFLSDLQLRSEDIFKYLKTDYY